MKIKQSFRPCPTCGTARKIPHTTGAALREAREAAELSLRQAAELIGVSHGYLSDVEHERRRATPEIVKAYEALARKEGRP